MYGKGGVWKGGGHCNLGKKKAEMVGEKLGKKKAYIDEDSTNINGGGEGQKKNRRITRGVKRGGGKYFTKRTAGETPGPKGRGYKVRGLSPKPIAG